MAHLRDSVKISRMLKRKLEKILNTEKAIPLCGSVNFRLPTIRTATEQVYLCICYIHMKFPNYPECRYVIMYLTSDAISKHEAVFGDCRSERQIFQLLQLHPFKFLLTSYP